MNNPFDNIRQNLLRLWTKQLYEEYELICYHFNIPLYKPLIQVCSMKSRWGQWDPSQRMITLSEQLITKYSWDTVLEIFKHEIAHQMVTELEGLPESHHGEAFRRACQRLGMAEWAMAASGDLGDEVLHEQGRALSDDDERRLKRAEKLLALATSSNEHEALLAMQRVQALYEKFNIEQIRQKKAARHVYVTITSRRKRLAHHHVKIANILINHFFVEVIFSSLYDAAECQSFKTLEIHGTSENVQMAEYVYYFLHDSLDRLWRTRQTANRGRHARSSFFQGILTGFDDKLRKQKYDGIGANSEPPVPPGIVQQERQLLRQARQQLEAYLRYRHPKLVTRHSGSRRHDSASFEQGRAAGSRLNLDRPISQQNRQIRGLLNP